MFKWIADFIAARKKLSAAAKDAAEQRGTLLASGFIAGEAITGILLAFLFVAGIPSLTQLLTGLKKLPFLDAWGGWLSLVAFAAIAYCLVRVPLRKKSA
jgi:hypothetical protein